MKNKNSQSGNVLFYILIAVVLLAALSYAVSESGRGNMTAVTEEKAKLLATEIIEYANVVSNATAQLRLRSIKDTDLCFDDTGWGVTNYPNPSCSDDTKKIFHLKGGGVTWSKAPELAMDPAASPDYLWHIYGDNEVQDVGTTCGNDNCSDLVLMLDELRENVCEEINTMLSVNNPGGIAPVDTQHGATRFIGAYGYSYTIGDEDSALKGKTAACYKNTSDGKYTFYKVLIAR